VTNESHIAFYGPIINWTSGGQFTVTLFSNYAPTNGDVVIFNDSGATPAGYSNFRPYYFVNLNGTQFSLASKPGGAPIPLTDSYSGSNFFYFVSSNPPSTGSITSIGAPTSYSTEVVGMLNFAVAAGAGVSPATLADLNYRNQQAGLTFTSDPKWAMTTTFNQKALMGRRSLLSAAG